MNLLYSTVFNAEIHLVSKTRSDHYLEQLFTFQKLLRLRLVRRSSITFISNTYLRSISISMKYYFQCVTVYLIHQISTKSLINSFFIHKLRRPLILFLFHNFFFVTLMMMMMMMMMKSVDYVRLLVILVDLLGSIIK